MSLTPKPLPLFPSNQILAKPPWPNSRVPPTLSSCHLLGSTRDKPAWPIPLPTAMGIYGTTTEGGRYFSALSFSLSLISLSYFSVFIYILLLFLAEFFSLFGCLWVWVLKGRIFCVWGLFQMAVCVSFYVEKCMLVWIKWYEYVHKNWFQVDAGKKRKRKWYYPSCGSLFLLFVLLLLVCHYLLLLFVVAVVVAGIMKKG